MSVPTILSPIAYLLLSIFVFHFSINSPSTTLRAFLLPLFFYFAILSFTVSNQFSIIHHSLSHLWAHLITLHIAHVISLLFLEQRREPVGFMSMASLHATFRLWEDPQLISTKGPETSAKSKKNGHHKAELETEEEPLLTFFFLRLAKLTLYYHVHTHLLPFLFSRTIGQLRAEDVSPARTPLLPRLGSIDTREALVRSHAALVWVWAPLVVIDSTNALLSMASVLVGLSGPGDWPPLFGGPLAACGLRSFWSRFWHRLARRPYGNFGRAVASRVRLLLPGRSGPAVEGAVVACVVFFLSGVSHAAVSWKFGQRDWWYADLQWFMLNFLGCSLETAVTSVARRLAVRIGCERELAAVEGSWVRWLVGYAWTFAFFFWSVPMLGFPRVYEQLIKAEQFIK